MGKESSVNVFETPDDNPKQKAIRGRVTAASAVREGMRQKLAEKGKLNPTTEGIISDTERFVMYGTGC